MRIATFQSLRFVFIMLIVFSHIIGKSFDYGGECGVSFFFMLSGFVLSLGYGDSVRVGQFSTRRFFLRQLSKFYPLHLLMLVVFVVLDARLGIIYNWQHLLPSVLLLQSWIPYESYYFVANGSSWFLCDVLFFYLLFSLAFRWLCGLTLNRLLLLSGVVLAVYLPLAFLIPIEMVNSILYAAPWTRWIDFCIGILLCRLYQSSVGDYYRVYLSQQGVSVATFYEMISVLWLVASFFMYEQLTPRLRCAALFWLFIPPIILYYSLSDQKGGCVTRLLHHPILQWLGGISLEIYLVHMLVLRVVNSLMLSAGVENVVMTTTVSLMLIVLFAWLMKSFFVDKIYAFLIKYVI